MGESGWVSVSRYLIFGDWLCLGDCLSDHQNTLDQFVRFGGWRMEPRVAEFVLRIDRCRWLATLGVLLDCHRCKRDNDLRCSQVRRLPKDGEFFLERDCGIGWRLENAHSGGRWARSEMAVPVVLVSTTTIPTPLADVR